MSCSTWIGHPGFVVAEAAGGFAGPMRERYLTATQGRKAFSAGHMGRALDGHGIRYTYGRDGGFYMITAETVERAVEQLPQEELAKFRHWFAQFDADAWDTQLEVDAAAGKLDALAEEARADYQDGKAREI